MEHMEPQGRSAEASRKAIAIKAQDAALEPTTVGAVDAEGVYFRQPGSEGWRGWSRVSWAELIEGAAHTVRKRPAEFVHTLLLGAACAEDDDAIERDQSGGRPFSEAISNPSRGVGHALDQLVS